MSATATGLIAPHGGSLVDLMVPAVEREAVKASATKVVECSDRNACDVELLVVGGFSPLPSCPGRHKRGTLVRDEA